MKGFISFTNKKGILITINLRQMSNCSITKEEICIRFNSTTPCLYIRRKDTPELFEAVCVFFYFNMEASQRIYDGVSGEEFLGERYIYNKKNRARLILMRKNKSEEK